MISRYRWCNNTKCSVNNCMTDSHLSGYAAFQKRLPLLKLLLLWKCQEVTISAQKRYYNNLKKKILSGNLLKTVIKAYRSSLRQISIEHRDSHLRLKSHHHKLILKRPSHIPSSAIQTTINGAVDITHQLKWMICCWGRSSQPLQSVNKCLHHFSCLSESAERHVHSTKHFTIC